MHLVKKGNTLDYYIVLKDDVDKIWNQVKNLIARCDEDILNSNDILKYIKNEDYILWIGKEKKSNTIIMTAVIEIHEYPRHRICHVSFMAGNNMNDWIYESKEMLEEWSKKHNCHYLEISGRKGWKKMFTDYKEKYIVISKKL